MSVLTQIENFTKCKDSTLFLGFRKEYINSVKTIEIWMPQLCGGFCNCVQTLWVYIQLGILTYLNMNVDRDNP